MGNRKKVNGAKKIAKQRTKIAKQRTWVAKRKRVPVKMQRKNGARKKNWKKLRAKGEERHSFQLEDPLATHLLTQRNQRDKIQQDLQFPPHLQWNPLDHDGGKAGEVLENREEKAN
jgi:hypothetical protein